MITEQETSRRFKIRVSSKVTAPLEQQIYVVGRIETNAGVPYEHAAMPFKLKIVPKQQQGDLAQTPAEAKQQSSTGGSGRPR